MALLRLSINDRSGPFSTNLHLHRRLSGCASSTLMDIRQSTFTNHRLVYKYPISQDSHIPVSMLATLIASMLIGVMMLTVQIENPWLAGQIPTILSYIIIQGMPPASHSSRWNTSTKPDLSFVSIDLDSRLPDVACRTSHFMELPCQTSFCLFLYFLLVCFQWLSTLLPLMCVILVVYCKSCVC